MQYERFYRVVSLRFPKTSFLLFSENKLPDYLSWIMSSSLDHIVLTLDMNLLTTSIVSSTVTLNLFGFIPIFKKFSATKWLCCQQNLLQN